MIERLLLFGATGDLAGRFLLPALAELYDEDKLPDGFRVVGTARKDWEDEAFRHHVSQQLEQHAAGDVSADSREALVRSLSYRKVDFNDRTSVAEAVAEAGGESAAGGGAEPVAAYLTLPPAAFAPAVRALDEVGLPEGSRIVVEKPFGEDLESAMELNRLLRRVAGVEGEGAIFRVDHALGMVTVQNCWRRGSPTEFWSRCGTAPTSKRSTSCGTRPWPWKTAPDTTTVPGRSKT